MGFVNSKEAALWVVDVQERLFPHIDRGCEVLEKMVFALKGCQLLEMPIALTEQYPEGLGRTIEPITKVLPEPHSIFSKTTFSGYHTPEIARAIDGWKKKTWILVGIETHICVLQTAKDLLVAGYEVIVLNDATSSRSIYDFSTGIGELRDEGARLTSTESLFYELLRDSAHPAFAPFLTLLKAYA